MIDLAVAVVIGAAFTKIVNTIANGLISPLLSLISDGGLDFKNKYVNFSGQDITGMTAKEIADQGLAVFRYGELVTDVINFLIVALIVFLIARWAAKYFKALEATPPPMTKTEELLQEMRDHMIKGNASQMKQT